MQAPASTGYGLSITSPRRNLAYNCYGNHKNQAIYPVLQPQKMQMAELCTEGWILWQWCLLSRRELVLVVLNFAYLKCIGQYNHPVGNIYREQQNQYRQTVYIKDKSWIPEDTPSIVVIERGWVNNWMCCFPPTLIWYKFYLLARKFLFEKVLKGSGGTFQNTSNK